MGTSTETTSTETTSAGATGNEPTSSSSTANEPACGNSVLDPGETCDDGNLVENDGCQSDCTETRGVAIYAGAFSQHTCVLFYSGLRARCWGYNEFAQLGYSFFGGMGQADFALGDAQDEILNEHTIEFTDAIAEFAVGEDFSCSRTLVGDVFCWGRGEDGLLGRGKALPLVKPWPTSPPAEARVELGGAATLLGAGRTTACAVVDDQQLRCWGFNGHGEVGDGSMEVIGDDELPVVIDPGAGVKVEQIAGGGYHTCIRTDDGDVKCWGRGDRGQLGNGSIEDVWAPDPVAVVPLNLPVSDIAAGLEHTCVVHQFGGVRCWGANQVGQLGRGHTVDQGGPGALPSDTEMDVDLGKDIIAVQVRCGANHSCALTKDGAVFCWGFNGFGQLGYVGLGSVGKELGDSPAKAGPVPLDGPAKAIAVGGHHTCALLMSGDLQCWGNADFGQLGLGNTESLGNDMGEMPPPPVPYF